MKIYIQKNIGFYESQELGDTYKVGSTLQEYHEGAYILLSKKQIAFHKEHPEATPLEVFHMELIPQIEYVPDRSVMIADLKERINRQVEEKILSGFKWNGVPVWLSQENQMNYKAAYDLAVQLNGEHGTLPVEFKFGTDEEPVYHTFENLEEFTGFYVSATGYIQKCYQAGWREKDALNEKEEDELLEVWKNS